MREILFSAWFRNKMIYNAIIFNNVLYWDNEEEKGHQTLKHEKAILLQYTGLTDKNGVRIFEGDLVNYYTTRWVSESACDLFGVDGKNEFDAGGEVHRKYTGEIRFFPSVGFVIANAKMREVYSDGEYAHQVLSDEWGEEKKISYKIMSETKTRCEIIGNIHEKEK